MHELARRTRNLPAPPPVVWRSLACPDEAGTRPWLALLDDETAPTVLEADEPHALVWSTLWPDRPDDEVHFRLTPHAGGTNLEFVLLSPDQPDESTLGHVRRRLNVLLFADLRYSYGQ